MAALPTGGVLKAGVPALALSLVGCAAAGSSVTADTSEREVFAGRWRAELASPGGPLPFGLVVHGPDHDPPAVMINGSEEAPFSHVWIEGRTLTLEAAWYTSRIVATFDPGEDRLTGEWIREREDAPTRLGFTATRVPEGVTSPRFGPPPDSGATPGALADVTGVWKAEFLDEDGPFVAQGELRQSGERVEGTFLTATGDYRFLDGSYESGWLRLSAFDGAHAFLLVAKATRSGGLAGDFWSRGRYHATWRAERSEGGVLPDPYGLSSITSPDGRLRFSFPDRDGDEVGFDDARFRGKVVLVDIFGTWCPNCADQAPVLADWYARYRSRGLEIVGLAYEVSGDPARDRRQLDLFAHRHGIEFPLLLAGVRDKAAASATLPDLSRVVAYPTTILVGRDGRVRKVHTGFAGPGTGEHHVRLVRELEAEILRLLAEAAEPREGGRR